MLLYPLLYLHYNSNMATINQDPIAVLARRRVLLARVTRARDAARQGTSERSSLDIACVRSTARLNESASALIKANASCHAALNHRKAAPTPSLQKWRRRLVREMYALRTASTHLTNTIKSLTLASADVFGDVPVLRTRTEQRLGTRTSSSQATRRHSAEATAHLEDARVACAFVRKEISSNLIKQVKNRSALSIISDVRQKVHRYVTKITEQLALLAAADAEMESCAIKAKENQRREHAQHGHRSVAAGSASRGKCDGLTQLPVIKSALSLLIVLT